MLRGYDFPPNASPMMDVEMSQYGGSANAPMDCTTDSAAPPQLYKSLAPAESLFTPIVSPKLEAKLIQLQQLQQLRELQEMPQL